jgi:hypothetical protein
MTAQILQWRDRDVLYVASRKTSFQSFMDQHRGWPTCYPPTVKIRSFNAPRLMSAIIDVMTDDRCFSSLDRYFKSTSLKEDAVDLIEHSDDEVCRKAIELVAAIGSMSTLKLGKALERIKNEGDVFSGFRLVDAPKEQNVVLYQVVKVSR